MNIKPFIIVSKCGNYHLGVDSCEEAIFGSVGDYSVLLGSLGYPSVIGEFFTQYSEMDPYNGLYGLDANLAEDILRINDNPLKIYKLDSGEYVDITDEARAYISDLVLEAQGELGDEDSQN